MWDAPTFSYISLRRAGMMPDMGTTSAGLSDPRPDRARFVALAFACSLSLVTYLDRVCIMQVSEDIRRDLAFAPLQMGMWLPWVGSWQWQASALDQMGWVFSAFSIGYTLFEVPGGWLGDRWGARRVLIRIVIWWSIFTALTGVIFPTPAWPVGALVLMIAVRFSFGAGEAGAYPNLTRVVRTWFPLRERAGAQGAIWMSARLGGAIAPVLIGLLAESLGWQRAFWVLGAIGLGWAVLFYRFYREQPAPAGLLSWSDSAYPTADALSRDPGLSANQEGIMRPETGTVSAPNTPASWAERPEVASRREPLTHSPEGPAWRVLLRSGTVWAICAVSFTVCLGWYFYPTWQPEYLRQVYGISYGTSKFLTGLPFVCGAVGSILGGVLSDWLIRRSGSRRWGRSLMGVFGFGTAGLCVLATGLTSAWWQAMLLLCLAFFFNDLAIPVIWAVCADVGGRFVGSVAGLMNMVGGFGAILCPMLIPLLLDHLWPPHRYGTAERWQYVFAALASTWFIGAAAWLFVNAAKPLFADHRPTVRS
jgi:MFS family permease